jgi:putative lipoprotein
VLYLPSGPLKLPQVISGSGARYSDGETTFWIKGDDAYMEINGSVAEEAD